MWSLNMNFASPLLDLISLPTVCRTSSVGDSEGASWPKSMTPVAIASQAAKPTSFDRITVNLMESCQHLDDIVGTPVVSAAPRYFSPSKPSHLDSKPVLVYFCFAPAVDRSNGLESIVSLTFRCKRT